MCAALTATMVLTCFAPSLDSTAWAQEETVSGAVETEEQTTVGDTGTIPSAEETVQGETGTESSAAQKTEDETETSGPAETQKTDGAGLYAADSNLPGNVTGPLEDQDGLAYAEGAVTSKVTNCGTVFELNTQWNNQNKHHASIKDAQNLFGRKEFTLLADVEMHSPSGDPGTTDQRAAFTIGTNANSLRVPTWSGNLGYGGNKSGISTNNVALNGGIVKDGWNALVLVYQETGDGNGAVTVYLNGKKAAEVADVGFSLSTMSGITAMVGRSFSTSYMQEGRYDNIVVVDQALDEQTAVAETQKRKTAKDNLVDTVKLEEVLEEAKAYLSSGPVLDTTELEAMVAEAEAIINGSAADVDQNRIDELANKMTGELSRLKPIDIIIKGEDVEAAAQNVNGLTYKGWGMLNGNSTSNLLLDYKSENPEQYWAMMNYLFGGENPLFSHIKMEMGNDGNNSTGAEACTMRFEDEEADASRSPGFVMVADAKKINPDVKVSILYWEMPNWVKNKWNNNTDNQGYEALYKWFRETIFDAYEKYGYVVDFVNPDKNETSNPNAAFIKWYKNRVATETEFPAYMDESAREAYHNIRIIASDENKSLNIVPKMRSDEDLYNAVDIIGFHYRTNATEDYVKMADVDDKEVWYSEACATFGYSELQENKTSAYGYKSIGGYQGPLAMIDGYLNSFAASRRTHYIFQPAIGSFYEGIQYGHKELVSARDPWSGYIHYDPALYMIAHFSAFAKTGWENSDNTAGIWRGIPQSSFGSFGGSDNEHQTAGINGNASYMTLAAPDGTDFSTVFINNTQNAKTFRITSEGLKVAGDAKLRVWETATDSYMADKGLVSGTDGVWYVSVPAYSVVTATTLTDTKPLRVPEEGIHNEDRDVLDTDSTGRKNNVTTDEYLYADNFDYAEEPDVDVYNAKTGSSKKTDYLESRGNEPRYLLDSHGAWIVENGELVQKLSAGINQWNGGDPMTMLGDFRWMNYAASVDVTKLTGYATLVIRSQGGMGTNDDGYALTVKPDGSWNLKRYSTVVAQGNVTAADSYHLTMEGRGSAILAYINDELVVQYVDSQPMLAGRIKLASGWTETHFDNLEVKTLKGYIPYATSMIDGQDDSVVYEGSWSIDNPGSGSADNWYRTISKNTAAGASFTFPVNGTGFALIGPNSAGAELDIYVDGVLKDTAAIQAAGRRYEVYTMTGLSNAKHEVKVVVKSGTLSLDALYSYADRIGGVTDKASLQEVYNKYKDTQQGNYTEATWNAFDAARTEALNALEDENATQERVDIARVTLISTYENLLEPNTEDPQEEPVFAANSANAYKGLILYGNSAGTIKNGGRLTLDGSTGTYAAIDPKALSFDGRDTFTVSFHVNSQMSSGNFFTFAVGKNDQQYLFERVRGKDAYVAITKESYGKEEKISATADQTYVDRWTTMTLVVEPDKMTLYENGKAIGTVEKTVQVLDFGKNVQAYLGRSFYSGDGYFKGSFDEIEVFNRALNAEEVGTRYTPGEDEAVKVISPAACKAVAVGKTPALPETVTVETYGGEQVEADVKWNLEAADFSKAFETVIVQGDVVGTYLSVSAQVEVVPESTVYFIDTVEASPKADATTEPFAAVKALLGDQLLNGVSDQFKTDENTWGLVDRDAGTKGYSGTADKAATGIYGKNNEVGETLSYDFTLPAGTYTLVSAHREWWSMNRPMAATLTVGDQVTNAGNISINSGNVNATNVFRFTLEAEETVRYTVTSTGDQAPVISWLAVVKASGTPMIAQTVEELTEVPEKLQDKYASLDEMKEAMLAEAGKALDGDVTGYDLYNIRITVSRDGGLTWTEADKNDLPAGGVEITFKYPEGSSATEDYQFAVAGIWDGEVGVNVGSSLVYGNDGITMKVLSEGPVAVTYLKKEETPTETDPTETETDPTETETDPTETDPDETESSSDATDPDETESSSDATDATDPTETETETESSSDSEGTVDTEKLEEAIGRAEMLKAADYTAESYSKVEKALNEAKAAMESKDQARINKAAKALNDAIDALVPASAESSVPTPDTGDTTNFKWPLVVMIIALIVVAGSVVAMQIVSRKRKKDKK